jgi:hypothetical protein
VLIDNDEIEISCDALWFAKTNAVMDEAQERLFDRLQVIRVGDYGGTASTRLDPDEIAAIVRALRLSDVKVGLDGDERALLAKLTS